MQTAKQDLLTQVMNYVVCIQSINLTIYMFTHILKCLD